MTKQLRTGRDATELRAVAATLRDLGGTLSGSSKGLAELVRNELTLYKRGPRSSESEKERGGAGAGYSRAP